MRTSNEKHQVYRPQNPLKYFSVYLEGILETQTGRTTQPLLCYPVFVYCAVLELQFYVTNDAKYQVIFITMTSQACGTFSDVWIYNSNGISYQCSTDGNNFISRTTMMITHNCYFKIREFSVILSCKILDLFFFFQQQISIRFLRHRSNHFFFSFLYQLLCKC